MEKILTFTYRMYPEGKSFFVRCLDWDAVYSQGKNNTECKKNVKEVTDLMLVDLMNGTLHKAQSPKKIKPHNNSKNTFTFTFDLNTNKIVNLKA